MIDILLIVYFVGIGLFGILNGCLIARRWTDLHHSFCNVLLAPIAISVFWPIACIAITVLHYVKNIGGT